MSVPNRPVLRYHGGKWRLAPWVITHFPAHRCYVESFGGAASVLIQKPRSYAEVYNDLDGEVVNVFRVMRDATTAAELARLLVLTPFSRADFEAAYEHTDEPVERARRTVVKSFMGFSSAAIHDTRENGMRTRASTVTGYRSDTRRPSTTPASDWSGYPSQVALICERMSGVVIENRPAAKVMVQHDTLDTLHYVDPPYPMGTRGDTGKDYAHEMTDDDHRELAAVLRGLRGMVVVSGYPCALYDDELYAEWERHERPHLADSARKRTEVVWLNPACSAVLREQQQQGGLFGDSHVA